MKFGKRILLFVGAPWHGRYRPAFCGLKAIRRVLAAMDGEMVSNHMLN